MDLASAALGYFRSPFIIPPQRTMYVSTPEARRLFPFFHPRYLHTSSLPLFGALRLVVYAASVFLRLWDSSNGMSMSCLRVLHCSSPFNACTCHLPSLPNGRGLGGDGV